jgi:hypothetical protein
VLALILLAAGSRPAPALQVRPVAEGFLVFAALKEGGASIAVDGIRRDTLGQSEATIGIPPGLHTVRVTQFGFRDFVDTVRVKPNDVTLMKVTFISSRIRAASDVIAGSRVQDTVALRVAHLEPGEVQILAGGQSLAKTPATLWMPVGRTELTVGGTMLCLDIPHQAGRDTSNLLLRAGAVIVATGVVICDTPTKAEPGQPETTAQLPSGTPHIPAAAESQDAAVLFLNAVRAQSVDSLGSVWGSPTPLRDRVARPEFEARALVVIRCLANDHFAVESETGRKSKATGEVVVRLTRGSERRWVTFKTVRSREMHWYVESFSVESLMDWCSA